MGPPFISTSRWNPKSSPPNRNELAKASVTIRNGPGIDVMSTRSTILLLHMELGDTVYPRNTLCPIGSKARHHSRQFRNRRSRHE